MTNQTRDAFNAWYEETDGSEVAASWASWQAATAAERERCALVCRREAEIQKASAKFCGIDNLDQGDFDICEAAIRQGGDA